MAGIYVHIPYCRQKCNYCNFYSVAHTKYLDQIGAALSRELSDRNSYLESEKVETIYFGGGTPSLLSSKDIEFIINTINKNYTVSGEAEITLEANPDDLNLQKSKEFQALGINRLSIGIQSFRQEDLKFLSRTHSETDITRCIENAFAVGFGNLSIDLIYGIPTLTQNGWEENLEKAFNFHIPHISAYALTVEQKTPLEFQIRKHKSAPVDENLTLAHYHKLTRKMQEKGYEHYEISNFCLPGNYSKHNTSYWQGKPYLGIGPSAHSFNGVSRQWNIAHLKNYIDAALQSNLRPEYETLSLDTRYNEYVMTTLRTMWGADMEEVKKRFGLKYMEYLSRASGKFISGDQMIRIDNKLILKETGILFADGIAAELFWEEDEK